MAQVVCDFDQEVTSSVTYSSPIEDSDTGMLRSQQISTSSSQSSNGGDIAEWDSMGVVEGNLREECFKRITKD